MIRANLLPHSRRSFRAASITIDLDYLRQAFAGITVVALVALLGIGIGEYRLHRLGAAAVLAESELQTASEARLTSKRLALHVARYQEFAREAAYYRRSGADAAVALAEIGNRLPERTWIDDLTHAANGYELTGGAGAVGAVSDAIARLGRALPSNDASLVSLENRDADGIHFDARIAPRDPPAASAP